MELLALPFCKTDLFRGRIRSVGRGVVRGVDIDDFKLNCRVALLVVTCGCANRSVATSRIDQSRSDIKSCYRPFKDS